jgi:hypothetical protein
MRAAMKEVFFDAYQLNATTWFYLGSLLAITTYVRFSRLLSLRNWDVITLLLLAPGLLMVHYEERQLRGGHVIPTGELSVAIVAEHRWLMHLGYVWLFVASGYLIARCLLDLFLVRRPHLDPNLNLTGLAFLGISLLGFLMYQVAMQEPDPAGRASARVASKLLAGGAMSQGDTTSNPATPIFMMPAAAALPELAGRIQDHTPLEPPDLEVGIARSTTILCHLLVLTALVLIGWQHFGNPLTGVGVATLYLLLPLTALNIEKIDHLLPSVFLVWAVYAYRRPWLSGVLFGFSGVFLFPLFLVPLWTGFYWKRGARKFLAGFALVTAALLLIVWLLPALRYFMQVWTSSVIWNPFGFGPSPEMIGFWTQVTEMYRWPILIVYIAGAVAAAFWPTEKNLADLLALSVLLVVGMQFLYADRGGTYINWYLPLLLLMIFRPNLSEVRPPAPA